MALEIIYIVEEPTVKQLTQIDENVDVKLLDKAIRNAQDIQIQTALGTALYNKILTDIKNNTLSGNYLTLVETYITPALVEWVLYYVIPSLLYKYRNKAIDTQGGDNAQPISRDEMERLQAEAKNVAEWYTKRLKDYMCQFNNLFPELQQNNTGDMIQPDKQNYSTNIYLGDEENCCKGFFD